MGSGRKYKQPDAKDAKDSLRTRKKQPKKFFLNFSRPSRPAVCDLPEPAQHQNNAAAPLATAFATPAMHNHRPSRR